MPPALFPAAGFAISASAAATAAAAAAAAATAAAITNAVVASVITSVVSIGIQAALRKKPKTPEFASFSSGRSVVVRNAIEPRRVVYGEAQVSGPLIFAEVTGPANDLTKHLHLVIALAHGHCEEIGVISFNDNPLNEIDGYYKEHSFQPGPDGGDLIDLDRHLGAADQAVESNLSSRAPSWTTEHRLRGVTYLYVRLGHSTIVWVTGIPNIKAVVRGRRLYDPRAVTIDITVSSTGAPGVINTDTAHGLAAGDHVWIKGHSGGVPVLAKAYQVASVPSATSFTVLGDDGEPLALSTAGNGGTLTVMTWSDNPVLALLDYLAAPFGFDVDLSEIDEASFIAAANICDEMVDLT